MEANELRIGNTVYYLGKIINIGSDDKKYGEVLNILECIGAEIYTNFKTFIGVYVGKN